MLSTLMGYSSQGRASRGDSPAGDERSRSSSAGSSVRRKRANPRRSNGSASPPGRSPDTYPSLSFSHPFYYSPRSPSSGRDTPYGSPPIRSSLAFPTSPGAGWQLAPAAPFEACTSPTKTVVFRGEEGDPHSHPNLDFSIRHIAVQHQGLSLWTALNDGSISLRSGEGKLLCMLAMSGKYTSPRVSCLYASRWHLWVGLDNGWVDVYAAVAMVCVKSVRQAHTAAVTNFVTLDDVCIASVGKDGSATLWGISGERDVEVVRQRRVRIEEDAHVTSLAAGGDLIFAGTSSGAVHALNQLHLAETLVWSAHSTSCTALHFFGDVLYTGACDGEVAGWRIGRSEGKHTRALACRSRGMHQARVLTLFDDTEKMNSVDEDGVTARWEVGLREEPVVVEREQLDVPLKHFVRVNWRVSRLVWCAAQGKVWKYVTSSPDTLAVLEDLYKQAYAAAPLLAAEERGLHSSRAETLREGLAAMGRGMALKQTFVERIRMKQCFQRLLLRAKRHRNARKLSKQVGVAFRRMLGLHFYYRWKRVVEERRAARAWGRLCVVLVTKMSDRVLLQRCFLKVKATARSVRLQRDQRVPALRSLNQRLVQRRYWDRLLEYRLAAMHRRWSRSSASVLSQLNNRRVARDYYVRWKHEATTGKGHRIRCVVRQLQGQVHYARTGLAMEAFVKWRTWAEEEKRSNRKIFLLRCIVENNSGTGILSIYFRKWMQYTELFKHRTLRSKTVTANDRFNALLQELQTRNAPVENPLGAPLLALKTALGWNIAKWVEDGMEFTIGESRENEVMRRVARELQEASNNKPGDLLDELCENLVTPEGADTDMMLWDLCQDLKKEKGTVYDGREVTSVQLFALRLYTLEGPDIDRHLGFGDVPPPLGDAPPERLEELKLQWKEYKEKHTSYSKPTTVVSNGVPVASAKTDRNPAVYYEMNKALRQCASQGHFTNLISLSKWAKLTTTLLALSSAAPMANPPTLYRGVTNLPLSAVQKHSQMRKGWAYAWLAPSSTSESREASAEFLKNSTPATNVFFVIHNCRHGLSLSGISQFPKESEVLVPPFSYFTVKEDPKYLTNFGWVVELEYKGTLGNEDTGLNDFLIRTRSEMRLSEMRLNEMSTISHLRKVEGVARAAIETEEKLEYRNCFHEVHASMRITNAKNRYHAVEQRRNKLRERLEVLTSRINAPCLKPIDPRMLGPRQLTNALLYLKGVALDLDEDRELINQIHALPVEAKKEMFHEGLKKISKVVDDSLEDFDTIGQYPFGLPRMLSQMDANELLGVQAAMKELIIAADFVGTEDIQIAANTVTNAQYYTVLYQTTERVLQDRLSRSIVRVAVLTRPRTMSQAGSPLSSSPMSGSPSTSPPVPHRKATPPRPKRAASARTARKRHTTLDGSWRTANSTLRSLASTSASKTGGGSNKATEPTPDMTDAIATVTTLNASTLSSGSSSSEQRPQCHSPATSEHAASMISRSIVQSSLSALQRQQSKLENPSEPPKPKGTGCCSM